MKIKNQIALLGLGLLFVSGCSQSTNPESADASSSSTGSQSQNGESGTVTITEGVVDNCSTHEDSGDYVWDSASEIIIQLNGSSISVNGSGAVVDGTTLTITASGNYRLSGSLTNGQVIVDLEGSTSITPTPLPKTVSGDAEIQSSGDDIVRLILDGVQITNSTTAPVFINNADKTILVLADGSNNTLSDASTYVYASAEEDEPNAAVFSKDDLTIYGNGSLSVTGNYNDAIASKDGLIIASGTLHVQAADDGIRGKDYLVIENGNITVNSTGDGLKSDNDSDADKGYILVEDGTLNITAGGDAIAAETDVLISGGDLTVKSGGGSTQSLTGDESLKGIKGVVSVIIDDGNFAINSTDDAIHTNGVLSINGGTFNISSGDDGIHADSILSVNGGEIDITKSYEGIESRATMILNGGTIHVVASDDGINVAGGVDNSGWHSPGQQPGTTTGSCVLYINGGTISVNATGDGVDVNGAITMTDGVLSVSGPTSSGNGALDYDSSFKISGGLVVAAGSSGMAMAPSTTSTQNSVLITFRSTVQGNTLFHIQDSNGKSLVNYRPSKQYQSVAFSSPDLVKGTSYSVYTGGSMSGTDEEGLFPNDGVYTPGSSRASFTVSEVVTKVTAN